MNFHSMVLSEIREGHILHGIAYVCNLKNKSPIYKNRVQEVVVRGWDWGNRERYKGTDFQL